MLKQVTTEEGQSRVGQDYPEVRLDFQPKAALLMQREAQVQALAHPVANLLQQIPLH